MEQPEAPKDVSVRRELVADGSGRSHPALAVSQAGQLVGWVYLGCDEIRIYSPGRSGRGFMRYLADLSEWAEKQPKEVTP